MVNIYVYEMENPDIAVGMISVYKSFIWTNRYNDYGDFELYLPVSLEALEILQPDRIIMIKDSNRIMVIESIQIESNEDGHMMTVTGRSMESILDRRIVWDKYEISANVNFLTGLRGILNAAFFNPVNEKRKINLFYILGGAAQDVPSMWFSYNARITPRIYHGDNIYDVVSSLTKEFDLGFRLIQNKDPQYNYIYLLQFYLGKDRSYTQIENPFVVFSPKYANLLESRYVVSEKPFKNVVDVYSEWTKYDTEGNEQLIIKDKNVYFGTTEPSGLNRREMYTETSAIYSPSGEEYTDGEYDIEMKNSGLNLLAENEKIEGFDGKIASEGQFKYGEDYFLGDIVQIDNGFGMEYRVRITEIMESYDESGKHITPTFVILDDEEE